jgi:hypothetical protein
MPIYRTFSIHRQLPHLLALMPRPKGWAFLRQDPRVPIQFVPFVWNRIRSSDLIWTLPVSIRERIFRLSIQSAPPQYLAFPEHGRRYIDGVARPPPREITAKWAPPDFPFDVDALPPLPMIKSKKRLRRLFRCPDLAEALSVRNREGRLRTSWKVYDGIGDKLVNRAASLAVYRGLLKGMPSVSERASRRSEHGHDRVQQNQISHHI